MNIRQATVNDHDAWDAYVTGHPRGLAYHLTAWCEAVEKAYRLPYHLLLAENAHGVCGILPLIAFKVPLKSTVLISLPYCDVGGLLANDENTSRTLLLQAQEMMKELGADQLEVRSQDPVQELAEHPDNAKAKVRMLLDLPASGEELLQSLKSKVRSQAKKSIRDGLTATLGGLELLDTFYGIFSENMRDLGSPVHSRQWIRAILTTYGDRARVGIVSTPEGIPAAAGILLLHPWTASVPWASSLRRYNPLNPNMALYWTFLSYAADHGHARFDFGRSTPGEGTYRFKKQWGAAPHPLHWQRYRPENGWDTRRVASNESSFARELAARCWQKLPLTVATTCGPFVRRYVSL